MRAFKELENGVVAIGSELGLVPEDHVIDSGLVLGEPVSHAHGVDAAVVLNAGLVGFVIGIVKETGLAGVGSSCDEEIEGLQLALALVSDHGVEIVYDGGVAIPAVIESQLIGG